MRRISDIEREINDKKREIVELESIIETLNEEMDSVKLAQPEQPFNRMEQELADWLNKNDPGLLTECRKMRTISTGWDLIDCCDSLDSRTYFEYCESE
jgi:hypothetical protein